jgi:hypothetical protein
MSRGKRSESARRLSNSPKVRYNVRATGAEATIVTVRWKQTRTEGAHLLGLLGSEVALSPVPSLLRLSFRLAVLLELLSLFAQDLDGLLDRVQVGAQAQDGRTQSESPVDIR